MGKRILIYDTGQKYEIDSDLIYVPKFEKKSDMMPENEDKNENKEKQD